MADLRVLNAKESIGVFNSDGKERYSGFYVYVRTIDEYRTAIYHDMRPFKNSNLITRALFYNDIDLFDELSKLPERCEFYGQQVKDNRTEVQFPWNDVRRLRRPFRQFCSVRELMEIILDHDKLDQLFLMKNVETNFIHDVQYAYQFALLKMIGFKSVVPILRCPIDSLIVMIDYCFDNDMLDDLLPIYRYTASQNKQVRSYIRGRLGKHIHDYFDEKDYSDVIAIRTMIERSNMEEITLFINKNGLVLELIDGNEVLNNMIHHEDFEISLMNKIIYNLSTYGLTATQTISREVVITNNVVREELSYSQYNISLGIDKKMIHRNVESLFFIMCLPNNIDIRQFKGKSEIVDYLISRFYREPTKRAIS